MFYPLLVTSKINPHLPKIANKHKGTLLCVFYKVPLFVFFILHLLCVFYLTFVVYSILLKRDQAEKILMSLNFIRVEFVS